MPESLKLSSSALRMPFFDHLPLFDYDMAVTRNHWGCVRPLIGQKGGTQHLGGLSEVKGCR